MSTLDQWPSEATTIEDTDLLNLKRGTGVNSDKKITGANVKAHYATAAQGVKADSASQPGHMHILADVTDAGTAAAEDVDAFATDAEGALAVSASQPGHTHTALDLFGVLKADGSVPLTDDWDFGNKHIATTGFGKITAGGYITGTKFIVTGSQGIVSDVDDFFVSIIGGSQPAKGSYVTFFGIDDFTYPLDIIFAAAGITKLRYNHTINNWDFQDVDVIGLGNFNWGGDEVRIWNTGIFLGLYGSGTTVHDTSSPQIRIYDKDDTSGGIAIAGMTRGVDEYPGSVQVQGQGALPAAVTNLKGEDLEFQAGSGASASAGDAEGGDVLINGGIGFGTGKYGSVLIDGHNTDIYLGDDAGDGVFTIYDSLGAPLWSVDSLGNIVGRESESKSIIIELPTATEDISYFFTDKAITITQIRAVLVGSATPSVTWTVRHGTDRSAGGSEAVTGGTVTTDTTVGSDVTTFDDASIVADSHVWIETTAKSGTVDSIVITLFYTED